MNTTSIFKILICLFISGIIFPSISGASDFRAGDNLVITKNEIVNDDIYFAGNSVIVEGIINGDLVAAGSEIRVAGTINGSIMAAGGSIIVTGNVTDDIRAAGGEIRIGGNVGDNVLVFTGNFILEKNAEISRDLTLGADIAVIDGTVNGDIKGGVSDMEMRGITNGNVTLEIEENIKIFSEANIKGNLEYSAPRPGEISGMVLGKTAYKETPAKKEDLGSKIENEILGYLWLLLIGLISLWIAPELTQKNSLNVSVNPLKNLLFGLLFLIVVPVVMVLLFITIIGIPLGLILLAIYMILIYISRIYVGMWIGQFVLRKMKKEIKSKAFVMALGLLIMIIAINLPIIGSFIHLIIILLGLGTIVLTEFDIFQKLKEEKVI